MEWRISRQDLRGRPRFLERSGVPLDAPASCAVSRAGWQQEEDDAGHSQWSQMWTGTEGVQHIHKAAVFVFLDYNLKS